jgi:hypothetical protein
MPDRIEVLGFAELEAGTRKLAGNIEDRAGKEFLGVADQAAAKVRGSVHHRTGATAASVMTDESHGQALVGMGDGVAYAQFEEYGGRGWPHSATGNFLYPAAMTMEPPLIAAAEKAASREIGAMSWPSP